MGMKINQGQKHVLNLIKRDAGEDGWATVSDFLYPTLSETTPPGLVLFEKTDDGGRARLTEEGENVLLAMSWLE